MIYFLIGPLPSAAGTALGAVLADRLGNTRDVRWYMWLGALGNLFVVPLSIAFLLWPASQRFGGIPIAFYFSIAASIASAMWAPGVMAMAQGLARPEIRAFSAALWSMIFNFVGLGVGPLLVGFLSDHLEPSFGIQSVRYALAIASLVPLLAVICQFRCARTLREDLARARS